MGRYFPKINLRPDLPPGSEAHKSPTTRRSWLVFLVVGVLVIIGLFAYFGGNRKKEPPRITVKVGTTKPQNKEAPPLAPTPPSQGQEESHHEETTPPPLPLKTQKIIIPHPREKVATEQGTFPSKSGIPASGPAQKKPPSREVERLQVVLFPGLHPVKVKEALAREGIEFKEGHREVTTTLWRAMVETPPASIERYREKVKGLTGSTPWRLKTGNKLYLVVASFKDKEPARDLVKRLESRGFKTRVIPVSKKVNLKVVVFPIQEEKWKSLKTTLEKLGAQVVESGLLDHNTPLSQPASTTSQGKGSSSSLPR